VRPHTHTARLLACIARALQSGSCQAHSGHVTPYVHAASLMRAAQLHPLRPYWQQRVHASCAVSHHTLQPLEWRGMQLFPSRLLGVAPWSHALV